VVSCVLQVSQARLVPLVSQLSQVLLVSRVPVVSRVRQVLLVMQVIVGVMGVIYVAGPSGVLGA